MGRKTTRRRWPGGYIHRQEDGRDLYVIELERGGKDGVRRRYHVSTRAHGLKAAMEHLERFEANPLAYDPAGVAPEAPLRLTDDLVAEFKRWQLAKPVTKKHADNVETRLAD